MAVTRAKRALMVVGDESSLTSVIKASLDKGQGDVKNYWPEYVRAAGAGRSSVSELFAAAC